MEFFGISISDGKALKPLALDENLPVELQWFYKHSHDITCIDYTFREFEFSLGLDWDPESKEFKTLIIEGSTSMGGFFYRKYSYSIEQLKNDFEEAVNLIQSFKEMSKEEILKRRIE